MNKNVLAFIVAVTAMRAIPAQIPANIEFRVPKAPTVLSGDSGSYVVYELHITNLTTTPVSLKRVEVMFDSDTALAAFSVSDSVLERIITRPGLAVQPSERTHIANGTRAHVYLWLSVDKVNPPGVLRHRLTLQRMFTDTAALKRAGVDTAAFTLAGAVVAVTPHAVPIHPPLRGEWLAANGPSNLSGHRRTAIAINGTVAIGQRFAIDFLQVDDSGHTWRGDSTSNASYFAYGKPIYAVGNGVVVETKDSIPENTPRGPVPRAVPITLVTVGGNHVVVDMGNGHFAFYAHIQPGTLRAKVGNRVTAGQVLGLVGNSGNSTEPHLHFHVSDGVSPLGAEGIPYSLDSFEVFGRCEVGATGIRCTRASSHVVREAMPLQNERVRFAEFK